MQWTGSCSFFSATAVILGVGVVPATGVVNANAAIVSPAGVTTSGAPETRGKAPRVKTIAPTKVDYRSVVPFTGIIKPKREGVTVKRMMLLDGKWVTRDRTVTGPGGKFSFAVGPFPVGVTMFYRVVAIPNDTYPKKVKSKTFTVRSTTLKDSPARDNGPSTLISQTVSLYGPDNAISPAVVTLYGSVAPARGGVVVARQRFVNGAWQTLSTTTTSWDGSYAFAVSGFMPLTVYRYRTVVLAAGGYSAAFSPDKFVSIY